MDPGKQSSVWCSSLLCSLLFCSVLFQDQRTEPEPEGSVTSPTTYCTIHFISYNDRITIHAKKLEMSMSSKRKSSRLSTAGSGGGALAATSADTTSWSSAWPLHSAPSNGR